MKTKKIKTSNEINVSDTVVYTGNPRGAGVYVPEIGQRFPIRDTNDCIWLSIEMIERGRGYEKLIEE